MRLHPHARRILFWVFAGLASVALAYGIATRPEDTFFWSSIAIITYILVRYEKLALYVFLFLPVIGELVRLPWGPENGILLSDLFIPLFVAVWLAKKYLINRSVPKNRLLKPFIFFCCIAVISLLQAFLFLKPAEILTSSFYLVRFASYALLYLVVADSIKDEKQAKKLLSVAVFSAVLIAVAGFIQLIIYPDLGNLEQYGWDPHLNRLVSTWLDPNFIGGLLAFIICILLGLVIYVRKFSRKIGIIAVIAVLSTALLLTYSRSAYLALAAGIFILGLLKSRKLLIGCLLIFIIGIGLSPRAEQRLSDLSYSVSSFLFNASENPDPTARLRIKSWEQTLELIARRPLLGSGYNTLRYVNYNEGFVTDPKIHSASGSDSSLLTILATTGVAGLIPFLWFYSLILKTAWLNWKAKTQTLFNQGFSLGMFAGVISLLCHSLFVNSLLFPQILIFLMVQTGILVWINGLRPTER